MIRLNLSSTHYLIYGSGCVNLFSASMNGSTVFMPAFTQAERIIELLMSSKNYKQFCRKFPCSLLALLANLTLLEVTQLPRERWHPAGSGSTTRRLDDSTTRLSSPKSELAERPPEMAVIATA